MNKKRVINPHQKLGSQEITDGDNDILGDIYKQLDQLYKMRLIQKLARPIDIKNKEGYAENFLQTLRSIHIKLDRFRSNLI